MGYRSEVALAVTAEALTYLMAKLAGNEEARKFIFECHDLLDTDFDEDGGLKVYWDCVKWYSGYEEVQAIEAFMNDMDSRTSEYNGGDMDEHYRFCRIGEDRDDNEERGYLEAFDIERRITI